MRLRPDKKEERRRDAEKRTKAWRELTLEQQIESLNTRRGNSTKQKEKIQALINVF
jgi:hypothetical protein